MNEPLFSASNKPLRSIGASVKSFYFLIYLMKSLNRKDETEKEDPFPHICDFNAKVEAPQNMESLYEVSLIQGSVESA